ERRWEVATGKPLPITTGTVQGRKFLSPDGRILAVLKGEDQVALLEGDSGKEIGTIRLPHWGELHKLDMTTIDTWAGLLFTADGRTLITRGADRQTLCLWKVPDGKKLRELRVERDDLVPTTGSGRWIPGFGIGDVALLADGATLAVYFWGHYRRAKPWGHW